MADQKGYVNVNINVNGTVHRVRIQEGVAIGLDQSYNTPLEAKNGTIFSMEEKTEKHKNELGEIYDVGTGIFTAKTTHEIKMSEAEFALFRNVADNVKEGDMLTLSKADIDAAQNLYKQGKFTADVTKNIPQGFYGSKDMQDLGENTVRARISNYDENAKAVAKAAGKEYHSQYAAVVFNKKPGTGYDGIDRDLERYLKLSADGTVTRTFSGPGEGDYWSEYTYTDKNGNKITMSPDYNQNAGKPNKEVMIKKEYTDSNGKHVIDTYVDGTYISYKLPNGNDVDCAKVVTSKTTDGKEVIELYKNSEDGNKKVLDKVIVHYTNNGKKVIEYHNKDGALTSKTVDYEENGKKVHEDYNEKNNMTGKSASYTKGNKSVREAYDGQNKYVGKEVSWNVVRETPQGVGTITDTYKEQYNSNNKLIEKVEPGATSYYDNGVITKKELGGKEDEVIYYKNGKFSHRAVQKYGKGYKRYECVLYHDCVAKCGNFDVEAEVKKPLSEKAQEYRKKFTGKSPKEIAKTLKGQIDGPSFNDKTLAMIDAIPTGQFLKVMKEYAQTGGIWFGNKASLFKDLMNEWNIEDEAFVAVAKKAYASYLLSKQVSDFSENDIDMAQKVSKGCSDSDKVKEFMQSVEKYILPEK